ncbi:MAG: energy transducer TonB [Calditrichaeota bacterium]|nr:energy transducer TonB [Calditrichota bacterium]
MDKAQRNRTILFHLSTIAALFLVTCSFYFISFPTAEKLLTPFKEDGQIKQIDLVPQTVQPETPPKPQPPLHDFGDIQIDDDVTDVDVLKPDIVVVKDPLANVPREIADEPIAETTAGLSRLPELIHKEQIIYPQLAVINGIEGTVHVGFVLSKAGVPEDIKIVKTSNFLLNEAALAAVEKYRYTPALQRMLPVRLRMIIPVKFKLH